MTPKTVEAILFELREKVATGLTVRESGHPETWPKTSFGRDLMDAFDEIRARLARDRGTLWPIHGQLHMLLEDPAWTNGSGNLLVPIEIANAWRAALDKVLKEG